MTQCADVTFQTIAELSARIRDGQVSPVLLTERCLGRIHTLTRHSTPSSP
jgi:Asp-tRNA(Asn)/Glu-tRNA(Gln) amidotransferase A subunit family amidase